MTIKEIHTKAGSMSSYMGYAFILFCWYFLDNRFTALKPAMAESSIASLMEWGFRIVIVPFLLAGVLGGIYKQQRSQEGWSIGDFFTGAKTYYWRIMAANLLSIVFLMIVTIVVFVSAGIDANKAGDHKLLLAIISIPSSAINLFWFTAIVVERKIFRGLLRSLRTLLFNPFALVIGILWGVISFAVNTGIDFPSGPIAFALDGIRAVVLAVVRILTAIFAFAIYRQIWGKVISEEIPLTTSASVGDGLVNASFGFTFVSFLPLFHLVALILGIIALKRKKQFVMKSAIACCVGGFFTTFYFFLIAGWLISRSTPLTAPKYTFLTDVNADLKPQVMLLEQRSFQKVQQQLGQNTAKRSEHHWVIDTTLAIAKLQAHDLDGALEDFGVAVKKNPERSEFYYYYGIALLENGQEEVAAEQFQAALLHEPRLEGAERYLALINTAYTPSRLTSALLFVLILLMSFTLHEYGHAFAAWKLGDDTAQKQGRLTLNPLPHLEIFGSVILPAILLWQQSEVVFGWAKPVPVNPENFKDPKIDHIRVSFAGPAMNLMISMVSFVILGCIMLFIRLFWPETLALNFSIPFSPVSLLGPPFAKLLVIIIVFLKQLLYTSLVLGCFNLIPIPPLDGSWIFSGLLPERLHSLFERTRKYGFVIFLLLVVTSTLNYFLMIPIGLVWGTLQLLALAMGFS